MASRSWNRVELIGNLTRDPELRYTPNGVAVATIGLATNRTYVVEGERKEEVDFHKIVAWNKLAELCNQLLKKGSRVFMSGRLQYREWETQEGQKRRDAEIVLEDMILLTSKNGSGFGDETEDVNVSDGFSATPSKATAPAAVAQTSDDTATPAPASDDTADPAPAPKADETVSEDDLPF